MTNEAINKLKKYTAGKKNKEKIEISVLALNRIIFALKQEPCEDAISRQAVLEIYNKWFRYCNIAEKKESPKAQINALPSVIPKQKTGRWIFVDKAHEHVRCSECSYGDVDLMDGKPHNYCQNCGIKMLTVNTEYYKTIDEIKNMNQIQVGKIYSMDGFDVMCITQKKSGLFKMQTLGMTSGPWPGEGDISDYNDDTKTFTQEWAGVISKFRLPKLTEKIGACEGKTHKALTEAAQNYSSFGASDNGAWLGTVYGSDLAWCVYSNGYVSLNNSQNYSYVAAPSFLLDSSKVILDGDEIKRCSKALRRDSMVINREDKRKTENVEFISYSGKYPCLCFGELTLRICGEECVFGHSSIDRDTETGKYLDGHYDRFWSSGGAVGFSDDYSDSYVAHAEWIIDAEELPEKFRKYADEIDRVFNDNVEHGCCGGCL